MAMSRSVSYVPTSGGSLVFEYQKKDFRDNPVTYFNSGEVTAVNIVVVNKATGATILATTSMSYVSTAGQERYRYVWAFGSLLDGIRAITVYYAPTLAGGVPSALAPPDFENVDLSNIPGMVWDEVAADHATAGTIGKRHADTGAAIDAHRAEVEPELDQIKQDTTTDLPAQITTTRADILASIAAIEANIGSADADSIRAKLLALKLAVENVQGALD